LAWLTIKFSIPSDEAEAFSDALTDLGALSVSIEDADAGTFREQPIFGEPGMPEEALWDTCCLSALFPEGTNAKSIIDSASGIVDTHETPVFVTETVEENDWVRLTQSQFEPIEITSRLWIVPTWHEAPNPHAINIKLDPGVAFGTGSHPTTKLCLNWLEENIKGGETVLDYGCGSGILAIAAKKLGASQVTGIDIDAQAVDSSRNNASANDVEGEFHLPSIQVIHKADITVANILSNPLKVLASLLANCTRPGGQLVLSGILSPQAEEIMTYYQTWFSMNIYKEENGWVCLEGIKHSS
jgi:ribosomal protein L11 methyltransferase